MSVEKVTQAPTEADLEANIAAALRESFPWLSPEGLSHQTRFTFKFGHSMVTVDGTEVSKAQARLDILVSYQGKPIAIVELKRKGISLTKDDEMQGLSYARMVVPNPPLVVVTNGDDTKILATHTGAEWSPADPSEDEVQKLINATNKVAADDLKRAVEVLLGPQSTVWVAALRAATAASLKDLTGQFSDACVPFVAEFLVPRTATQRVIEELTRKRIVIVEGAPLAGKSNVLRELALLKKESTEMAVLFIEGDGGGGAGVLQSLAHLLANTLGWHVTAEETRAWLRSLSHRSGIMLVLAIDGISATRNEVRRDIEELTGDGFGSNLRFVLAVDDAVTPQLIKNETGRKTTRIGRRAVCVSVATLSDREFRAAVRVLGDHRIGIIDGGEHAPELRVPWVLRALASHVVTSPKYADVTLMAGLPPLLGPELLIHVRERFHDNEEIRHLFQGLAESALEDVADRKRMVSTIVESMATFAIRRKTVRNHMESGELATLADRGFVKLAFSASNEQVVIPRIPELLASEVAFLIARKLAERIASSTLKEAADWLVEQTSYLPVGDVIGAQAIFDCALAQGGLSLTFIECMLSVPPRRQKIAPGTRTALYMPDVGKIELTFRADGRIVAQVGSYQEILEDDGADPFSQEMYADIEGWLILSHVAGRGLIVQSQDGMLLGRVDPAILTEVGTCPIVLRRPPTDPKMSGVTVHDMKEYGSIVCHKMGIVEPITMSILKFFSPSGIDLAGEDISDWIEQAVARKSLPLVARIDIALRHLVESGGDRAKWGKDMLRCYIEPALAEFPSLH